MAYDREELVREITEFYELLVRLYLPEDSLKYPPQGGWPQINPERFAFLGKDDTVIDLLKHLPYIDQNNTQEPYHIYEYCVSNDYAGSLFDGAASVQDKSVTELSLAAAEGCLWEKIADPKAPRSHIATLGRSELGDKGYWLFCDTRDGEMVMVDVFDDLIQRWDNAAACFSELREEFYTLRALPLSAELVYRTAEDDDDIVKQIIRECGWPSLSYRKEEAMARAHKAHAMDHRSDNEA